VKTPSPLADINQKIISAEFSKSPLSGSGTLSEFDISKPNDLSFLAIGRCYCSATARRSSAGHYVGRKDRPYFCTAGVVNRRSSILPYLVARLGCI
jgi:hypothetical protein